MSKKVIDIKKYNIRDAKKLEKSNVEEIYIYASDGDPMDFGTTLKAILKNAKCKVWICSDLKSYRIDVIMACVMYIKLKHGGGFVSVGSTDKTSNYLGVRVRYVKELSEVFM